MTALALRRRYMLRLVVRALLVLVVSALSLSAQSGGAVTTNMPFADAKPILEALHDSLPAELKDRSPADLETVWSGWVSRRDEQIRARLERGDEDSLVNFLLFGTTFTKQPRALNDSTKLGGREQAGEIVRGRIRRPGRWASRRREPTSGCNLPGGSSSAGASIRKRPRDRHRCAATSSRR